MSIEEIARQELLESIERTLVTTNARTEAFTEEDEAEYAKFVNNASKKDMKVVLPMGFVFRKPLFDLIKTGKVFMEGSSKFRVSLTTKEPEKKPISASKVKYVGNEFSYTFLDNHPGIINVNKLEDIPSDYEGLMAVPATILTHGVIDRFNVHRTLMTPKHNGRFVYPRVVITNKYIANING